MLARCMLRRGTTEGSWSTSSWHCGARSAHSSGPVLISLSRFLALRQQVAVLKRKRPQPPLTSSDRLFWVLLRRFWSGWKDVLVVVQPDTVVAWHRAGFRWYWRWRSRRCRGRSTITEELRQLIRRLAEENAGLGRSENSRRATKAGIRRFGTNGGSLSSSPPPPQ